MLWVRIATSVCLLAWPSVRGLAAQQDVVHGTVSEGTHDSADTGPAMLHPRPAHGGASVLRLIRFNGTVREAEASLAVGGGSHARALGVTFALYAEPEGGAPLWVESQNVELDEQGRYTVLLGATTNEGLPLELFSSGEARWLGVQVQGQAEQSRVLLVSVPYALKAADAERLEGRPASAFVLAQASEAEEAPIGGDTKAVVTASGTTNFVAKFTGTESLADSQIVDNGTNVGIGSTAPLDRLHVNGNIRLIGQTTHQVQMNGAASVGRLGQDANGFFFASDTPGKQLNFFTNAGAGIQRRLTITGSGNVGIGTASPAERVHIVGNLRLDSVLDLGTDPCSALSSAGRGRICFNGTKFRVSESGGAYQDLVGGAGGGWSLTGNAGTTAGTNFLGTTDNVALELHVNSVRALRMEPDATSPNIVGGFNGNTVGGGIHGATIGGGGLSAFINQVNGDFGTVGGGANNTASSLLATVGGGSGNSASGLRASVGGGFQNTASGSESTVGGGSGNLASGPAVSVGGGFQNTASGGNSTVGGGGSNTTAGSESTVGGGRNNTASGGNATIGGGFFNTASGGSSTVSGGVTNTAGCLGTETSGPCFGLPASGFTATIPGGSFNEALADFSFAAGRRSKARHAGAFVWGDSTDADFASTAANQFLVRAGGGVGIGTNAPTHPLHVQGLRGIRIGEGNQAGFLVGFDVAGGDIQLRSNITQDGVLIDNSKASWALRVSGGTDDIGFFRAPPGSNSFATVMRVISTGATITGNLSVSGTVSKGGGSFKIDHPLDPENKYLYHSFVESPEMKNVYDGVAALDTRGEAMVDLPVWFEALNRDFRYQLTCIGGFAPVYIAEEIHGNRFRISGGRPGMKVSWQVTGIRRDAYARAHPIQVEEAKPEAERGTYLHPEAFGISPEKRLASAPVHSHPRCVANCE